MKSISSTILTNIVIAKRKQLAADPFEQIKKSLEKRKNLKFDLGIVKWLESISNVNKDFEQIKNVDALSKIVDKAVTSIPVTKTKDKEAVAAANSVIENAKAVYSGAISLVYSDADTFTLLINDSATLLKLACALYAGDFKKAGSLYDSLDTATRDELTGDVHNFIEYMHFPLVKILTPSAKIERVIKEAINEVDPGHKISWNMELYFPSSGDLINDYGFDPKELQKVDKSVVVVIDAGDFKFIKSVIKVAKSNLTNLSIKTLEVNGNTFVLISK